MNNISSTIFEPNWMNTNIGNDSELSLSDLDEIDENNELEPLVVTSPLIKIASICRNEGSMDGSKIANDLNSRRGRSTMKEKKSPKPQKSKSTSRSTSREEKKNVKLRQTDHHAQIKIKLSPFQIEFISAHLKNVIFSAWVEEREYVENLGAYRDIVKVDEWEDDLNLSLKNIMHSIKGVMEGTKWINITVPSSICSCYCLWVLFDDPPSPGHYWIQITSVTLEPNFGLKIAVKILREIHAFDGETKSERDKRCKKEKSFEEWREWFTFITSLTLISLCTDLITLFKPSNIVTGIRIFIVLLTTLIVSLTEFLKQLGKFLLLLTREMGIFVHHVTPFLQCVIGFFEKLVGGCYLLLAMVYRDLFHLSKSPPSSPFNDFQSPRPITYGSPEKRHRFY